MKRSTKVGVTLMLAALIYVGCGPEDDNNFNGFPNNTQTDSGMDAGDATEEVGADADSSDAVGDVIIGQSCEARPEDLGTLSVGESLDFDRPYRQRPEGTQASCQEPPQRAGIYVFEFQVEETSKVDVELYPAANTTPVMELRVGECLELGASEFCGTQTGRTAVVEPDVSYYLFIQGSADSFGGTFRLTFDVAEAACGPADEICESGAQQFCPSGDDLQRRSCAEACASEEACTGDTCDNALQVDVSGGTQTLSGDRYAYVSNWSAEGRSNCALYESGEGSATPDEDVFMEISGHQSGDEIVFDASESDTTFGFYVLDACDASSCVAAGVVDDPDAVDPPNTYTWTATTSDPVIVVAESLGPRRDWTFNIDISTQ